MDPYSNGSIFFISRWLPVRFRTMDDHARALRIRIFLILMLLCIAPLLSLLLILVGVLFLGHTDYEQATWMVALITFSQIGCLLYFLHSDNIDLCSLIYAAIIFVLIGAATYMTGSWNSPVCNFMLALPVIACLVISRFASLVFCLAVLLLYCVFFFLTKNNYSTHQLIPMAFMPYASIGMWLTTLFFLVGCLLLFDFSTEDLLQVIQHERKQLQQDVNHDSLTRALRQKYFIELTRKNIEENSLNGKDMAIIHIQVNNLKEINQNFGIEVGDLALKSIYKNISVNFDKNNIYLSRYTISSFVLFIKNASNLGDFISKVFKITNELKKEIFFRKDSSIKINFKIGAVITSNKNIPLNQLIEEAKENAYDEKSIYTRK